MTKLSWGTAGERYYETGVDRGVLYTSATKGVAWNGLVSVTESPSGGESKAYYMDGVKYLNRAAAEEFEATIQAFSSPQEFDEFDGTESIYSGLLATHQRRKPFGFSYRTKLGNDVDGVDHGYKLHLIYNALAEPSERANQTLGDASEPADLSWTITTIPQAINQYKATAHLVIDSIGTHADLLVTLEDILYGSVTTAPRMPTTTELLELFALYVVFKVTVTGPTTYTAEGLAVVLVSPGIFTMDHERVIDNGDGSFTILDEE